jgi:sigma-E factor negative regulatory protein RseB
MSLTHTPWRIASVAVALGLLGSLAAVLALADSASPAMTRRSGSAAQRRSGATTPRPGYVAVQEGSGAVLQRRAGQSLRSLRPVSAAAAARARAGLRLMSEAAAACATVSYSGVQVMMSWGDGGTSAAVDQVWHRPGGGTLAQASPAAALPGAAGPSAVGQEQAQDGVLAVSGRMLDVMRANYQILYTGTGTADNRPAKVVELWRPDGTLAARFWLDAATKLPLRREIFADHAGMISEDAFINLEVGERGLAGMPAAETQPWTGQLDPAALAALRSRGWPLPASLAGGLTLLDASETSTRSGKVIDLSYSDGLSVLSLFLQRGDLPRTLPGWQRVAVRGHSVLASDPDDQCLAWSADGFVYTLIADAPPATVNQAVAALPHDGQIGFWKRMVRGFRRLASWANPFG